MTGSDDLADSIIRATQAYTDAYLRLEGSIPGFSATDIDGLHHIHYGRPKAGASHELLARSTPPDDVIGILDRHPELTDAFVCLFTTNEDAAERAFSTAGYTRVVHNFLMRRDVTGSRGARADDSIVQLTTAAEIEQLADLREDHQILPEHLADPAIRCYALVVDDVPAASALLIVTGGDTAVIEYVHTLATYRRRGYGRWLMRALQREAAHLGAQSVVLSSNDTGKPLYVSLRYEVLGYEDVYLRETSPPGPPPRGSNTP